MKNKKGTKYEMKKTETAVLQSATFEKSDLFDRSAFIVYPLEASRS
jgi:hypothetical protein